MPTANVYKSYMLLRTNRNQLTIQGKANQFPLVFQLHVRYLQVTLRATEKASCIKGRQLVVSVQILTTRISYGSQILQVESWPSVASNCDKGREQFQTTAAKEHSRSSFNETMLCRSSTSDSAQYLRSRTFPAWSLRSTRGCVFVDGPSLSTDQTFTVVSREPASINPLLWITKGWF